MMFYVAFNAFQNIEYSANLTARGKKRMQKEKKMFLKISGFGRNRTPDCCVEGESANHSATKSTQDFSPSQKGL